MTRMMRTALACGVAAAIAACGEDDTTPPPNCGGGPGCGPIVALSVTAVTFPSTQAGGELPPAQAVTVTNSGAGTLAPPTATVAAGGEWLDATVASAGAGYTVTLRPNTTALPPATHTAVVQVASAGAAGSPAPIAVAWPIRASPDPVVVVSPASLSFTTTAGTNPASRTIAVTNGGAGVLGAVTATPSFATGSGWMTATVSGSGNAQTVTVSIAVPGAGRYAGAITIDAEGVASSASVPVSLSVEAAQPQDPVTRGIVAVGDAQVARRAACFALASWAQDGFQAGVRLRAAALSAAVAAGRLAYSEAGASACLDWIAQASCDLIEDHRWWPAVCDVIRWGHEATRGGGHMLAGQVANGGACRESLECANGWCAFDATCPGRCTAFTAAGRPCAGTACEPGFRCIGTSNDVPRCRPEIVLARLGEECDPSVESCGAGLMCAQIPSGAFRCVAKRGPGEICSPSSAGECAAGLLCVRSSLAVPPACVALAGQGASCAATGCGFGLYCASATATCVPTPRVGERCSATAPCLDGSFCVGATPVCTAGTAAPGDPCTLNPTATTSASSLCAAPARPGRSTYCAFTGAATGSCQSTTYSCYE